MNIPLLQGRIHDLWHQGLLKNIPPQKQKEEEEEEKEEEEEEEEEKKEEEEEEEEEKEKKEEEEEMVEINSPTMVIPETMTVEWGSIVKLPRM